MAMPDLDILANKGVLPSNCSNTSVESRTQYNLWNSSENIQLAEEARTILTLGIFPTIQRSMEFALQLLK
jgi:hypothetical protein